MATTITWLAGANEGETGPLELDNFTIGRDPRNNFAFPYEEALAKYHANFYFKKGQWFCIHLGSKKSTHVGGCRVLTRPVKVRSGQPVECGTETFILTYDAVSDEEPLEPQTDLARWFGKDESVVIGGIEIADPYIYVGQHLLMETAQPTLGFGFGSDYSFAMPSEQEEPSLINPDFPISSVHTDIGVQYQATYQILNPDQRFEYIYWLANGRSTPVRQQYIYLWFYGIERRLLDPAISDTERLDILQSLSEVLEKYPGFSNIQSYGIRLMSAHWNLFPDRIGSDLAIAHSFDLRGDSGLAWLLACLCQSSQPFTTELAVAWVELHRSELPQKKVVLQCWEELVDLFRIRFKERYSGKIELVPGRGTAEYTYHTFNVTLRNNPYKIKKLPKPSNAAEINAIINDLIEECTVDLSPYSRKISGAKNDEKKQRATYALPRELRRFRAVSNRLSDWLSDFPREETIALMLEVLLREAGLDEVPSKAEIQSLFELLFDLRMIVEPDPSFGASALPTKGYVSVSRMKAAPKPKPSEDFIAARVLAELGTSTAMAGGDWSGYHTQTLQRYLATKLHLSGDEQERLAVVIQWLSVTLPKVTKTTASRLSPEYYSHVIPLMAEVARVDGAISVAKVKEMERLAAMFGVVPTTLYSQLHEGLEPVSLVPPKDGESYRIVGPKPKPKPVKVDMEAVKSKMRDTAEVSSLLASIFIEEDSSVTATPEPAQVTERLLQLLGALSSGDVERATFDELASQFGLMPNAAIEALNEQAFEVCGAPLLEGDDPLFVDEWTLEEMRK